MRSGAAVRMGVDDLPRPLIRLSRGASELSAFDLQRGCRMMMDRGRLFTDDWPRYAVWAHVAFWILTALNLVLWFKSLEQIAFSATGTTLFISWFVAAFLVGVAAVSGGRLYLGPLLLTGALARIIGAAIAVGFGMIILIGLGLWHARGG